MPLCDPFGYLFVGAAWWMRGKIEQFLESVQETHTQVSNHIPHQLDEQTELLRAVDKNIAIMASNRREPRG